MKAGHLWEYKMYNLCGGKFGISTIILYTSTLTFDPAIPFPGTYTKDTSANTHSDICTQLFIAALFLIAKE